MMSSEKMLQLVQGQLEAYNNRDIQKFCTYFSSDIRIYRFPSNELIMEGAEAFEKAYEKRFSSNPQLHCEIKNRIIMKDIVLDEEWVTGVTDTPEGSRVMALYAFNKEKINQVWFAK